MTATSEVRSDQRAAEKSTADLVRDLTEQVGHLARTEVALAAHELRDKARHAGLGAAIAGAGGVLALYGGGVLTAAFVLLLALVMPAWAAALIVAGAAFLAAGVAMLVARAQLRRSKPLPSEAMESARKDVDAVKEASKR